MVSIAHEGEIAVGGMIDLSCSDFDVASLYNPLGVEVPRKF